MRSTSFSRMNNTENNQQCIGWTYHAQQVMRRDAWNPCTSHVRNTRLAFTPLPRAHTHKWSTYLMSHFLGNIPNVLRTTFLRAHCLSLLWAEAGVDVLWSLAYWTYMSNIGIGKVCVITWHILALYVRRRKWIECINVTRKQIIIILGCPLL